MAHVRVNHNSGALAEHAETRARPRLVPLDGSEGAWEDGEFMLSDAVSADAPGNVGLVPNEALRDALSRAQSLIADKRHREAAPLLDGVEVPEALALEFQLAWAEALHDAQLIEAGERLYLRLLDLHPGRPDVHLPYAKRLYNRGYLQRASVVIEPVAHRLQPDSKAFSLLKRIRALMPQLAQLEGREIAAHEDARLIALKHALAMFRTREIRTLPKDRIGRITLMTGSLGPGGAERQLSRTAAELENVRVRDGHVAGIAIERQVEVLVRSHGPEHQHDFYLKDLRDANVLLGEINHMPPVAPSHMGIADKALVSLLEFLPAKVNFGVRRLVARLRESDPDVVSMWQDGACLFAGLAALVAGVPKIQVVIRGLPPVIRRHMFQPDYEVMYRGLAEVPGVEFISNSKAAAVAYSEWLDIPIDRFSIVYNGVPRMACDSTEALDAQWNDFVARTADADQTIGGVFRFDTDKRPTWWVRFAYRYAKKHPKARFVVVGGGRLLDDCQRMAEELGVADRILFVGRSTDVGYWMKKMDVLVLMSSFEGLPNVLIEAQYLGVPVVSTPAGGASECFIEGVTGHILGCADKTDLNEACEKVHALLGRAQKPEIFEPATRDFLEPNFAVPRMIENFVKVTCGAASA